MFNSPDPLRVDGHATATRPLEVYGALIDGIRVEFEAGRAVKIDADRGADTLRSLAEKDDGASRLGELALVDGEGRIGPMQTVFYDTLLDENAASHIALGSGYDLGVDDDADRSRINRSRIHVDFMIGRRSWTSTGSPGTARPCRCCAQAPGRSSGPRLPRTEWIDGRYARPGQAAPARPLAAGRSPHRASSPMSSDATPHRRFEPPERAAGAR